ncbi:MAG: hypothetical protein QM647_18695 [Asticcacaulis sp.]|uniref:hypothetical protein n=1 Tax=Asticcacaulis sp. TaxID=1872648 RepID=UPI0039E70B55
MAQFISHTLELLASGDLSTHDACYSLSVYLVSVHPAEGFAAPPEADIQHVVNSLVHAVADGTLDADAAGRRLINLKGRLTAGIPSGEPLFG